MPIPRFQEKKIPLSSEATTEQAVREFVSGTGLETPDQVVQAGIKTIAEWCDLLNKHRDASGIQEVRTWTNQ